MKTKTQSIYQHIVDLQQCSPENRQLVVGKQKHFVDLEYLVDRGIEYFLERIELEHRWELHLRVQP